MKIKDLIDEGNKVLHKDQVKLILSTLLDYNYLELSLHLEEDVKEEIIVKFYKSINYVKDGKPIQYALNSVNFYGYNFYIDERVLIPRFETEELVYNTNIFINKYFNKVNLLDLCCGSGCIGLTLKKLNNDINLSLSDLSPYALEVCEINKTNLNVEAKIIESDLFSNISSKYDIIISNPPYVSKDDEIDELVINNEPKIALFANNDGLEFYERILLDCEKYLNDKYLIAFEIGESQKDKVIELINKYLSNVKIITKKDMSLRDRMVFIFKNIDINE